MIVSSKGRYALRVMVALAQRQEEGFIPLKDIAEAEGISRKYLESIMTILSKADFVATGSTGLWRATPWAISSGSPRAT